MGMAQWTHRIETTIEYEIPEAAHALAAELSHLPSDFRSLTRGGDSLDDMIDWLRALDETDCGDDFDIILNEIYDWADTHRLWLYLSYAGEEAAVS